MAAGDVRYDAVIVGGGPAGATAARLLASWGHSVCLLTRAPTRRSMAESLPPSAVHVLERVGVRQLVMSGGFMRSGGNTVWWGGDERTESFPAGTFGLQVDRAVLDDLLLRAAESAGVVVLRDASAREIVVGADADGAVRFEQSGEVQRVRGSWILDCSGRAGVAARRGGRKSDGSLRTTAVVGLWEGKSPWALPDWTHTTVESFDEGWAWSIPASEQRRFVAVMLDPARAPIGGAAGLAARYRRQLHGARRHDALTAGARLVREPFAIDASPYHADAPATRGLLLVGDAASFVDPLASFGVKRAMASAWLAAVVVHTDLLTPAVTTAALQLYARWEGESRAALRQGVAELAAMARADGVTGEDAFWSQRAQRSAFVSDDALDVRTLQLDPHVRAALASLQASEQVSLTADPACQLEHRPLIRENLVTVEEHLCTPLLPAGVRYLRNVDLLQLARVAVEYDRVPDILDAYNRRLPPAPVADLLGALSVLIAKRVLASA